MKLEIEVECKDCGDGLSADLLDGVIRVEACANCCDICSTDGFDDGKREGYNEGHEQGYAEGLAQAENEN